MRKLVCVLVCLSGVLVASPAQGQLGPDVADGCEEAGGNERMCRGFGHIVETAGVICREAGGGEGCANLDGRVIDEGLARAHARSWIVRALDHQRRLDDDAPLHESLWTHTHNSFNAEVYQPTLYGLDPNQLYSITDQLDMGIRAIELDFHYAFEPDAGRRVAVCHGHDFAPGVHFGCGVNDPYPADRLSEIRAWMARHPDEVVMIFIQNELEDDPAAHDEAVAAIRETFGPLVYRPPAASRCTPAPMDTSRRTIRSSGARVLIVSRCGPGTWRSWVFDRGPRWVESGVDYGNDYPRFPCAYERRTYRYSRNWIRLYEDLTGVTDGAGAFPGQSGAGDVTVRDARNMTRCGVNMIGLDDLRPFDTRLLAQIWSWARNEPEGGACAYQGRDGLFRADNCRRLRPYACQVGARWVVTKEPGPWIDGPNACGLVGARFAVPANAWQNELLKGARLGHDVWLNYADRGRGWTPRAIS